MAKKKRMIQSNLLKNSIAAYFAAIEIHNKPNIAYRYENVTLLIMNSWELVLKAFVRKYVKGKSIFEDNGHTISFDKALTYTAEYINGKQPKSFTSIQDNLITIEKYRNQTAHFYNEQLEPYIFMLTAKAALNYVEFVKAHFGKDILSEQGLFILPLGFKLPFKPQDFLSKKAAGTMQSTEAKAFVELMIDIIKNLKEDGIEDSIVLGFSLYLESVKKCSNSDLVAAIAAADQADATFTQVRRVQIVDDKGAAKIQLTDDELLLHYPLSYQEVCERCRSEIPNFKQGKVFYDIMKKLKGNQSLCHERRLNPKSKKTSMTTLYAEQIVQEIKAQYEAET